MGGDGAAVVLGLGGIIAGIFDGAGIGAAGRYPGGGNLICCAS